MRIRAFLLRFKTPVMWRQAVKKRDLGIRFTAKRDHKFLSLSVGCVCVLTATRCMDGAFIHTHTLSEKLAVPGGAIPLHTCLCSVSCPVCQSVGSLCNADAQPCCDWMRTACSVWYSDCMCLQFINIAAHIIPIKSPWRKFVLRWLTLRVLGQKWMILKMKTNSHYWLLLSHILCLGLCIGQQLLSSLYILHLIVTMLMLWRYAAAWWVLSWAKK